MRILPHGRNMTTRILYLLIGLTLLLAPPLLAQVAPTLTVSGVAKDAAGLAVPNAAVTLVNADSTTRERPSPTTTVPTVSWRFRSDATT